jgi:hypothetical protein
MQPLWKIEELALSSGLEDKGRDRINGPQSSRFGKRSTERISQARLSNDWKVNGLTAVRVAIISISGCTIARPLV